MTKKVSRQRRAKRPRMKMRQLGAIRLCVFRSLKHVYAQLIMGAPQGDQVLVCASTVEKEVRAAGAESSNVKSAAIVGKIIAERASAKGITKVAFDRSGFKYHGVIKALAEAAREYGLQF